MTLFIIVFFLIYYALPDIFAKASTVLSQFQHYEAKAHGRDTLSFYLSEDQIGAHAKQCFIDNIRISKMYLSKVSARQQGAQMVYDKAYLVKNNMIYQNDRSSLWVAAGDVFLVYFYG